MSARRPCRLSQVASSWLILRPGSWPAPRSINCTTMVRSCVLFLGALGGDGWGTSASKPLCVNGVITMKIMSSTSSTSMSGVTLMFALWPPLGPTAILMVDSPLLPTSRSGGRSVWSAFPLFGEQAQVIYTGGAHGIHHPNHIAVVGAGIRLEIDLFVSAIRQAILHLAGQTIHRDLVGAEVDGAIAHQQHQHHVHHRCHIDVGVDVGAFVPFCHRHKVNLQYFQSFRYSREVRRRELFRRRAHNS